MREKRFEHQQNGKKAEVLVQASRLRYNVFLSIEGRVIDKRLGYRAGGPNNVAVTLSGGGFTAKIFIGMPHSGGFLLDQLINCTWG